MSSNWNIVKKLVNRDQPEPEKKPLAQPDPKGKAKGNSKDIELGQPADEPSAFSKMKSTLTSALIVQKMKKAAEGAQEKAQMSMRFSRNLPFIIVLGAAGCFFMVLAFVFLPLILLVPHKFSLCFAIGGVCFISAIALVREPKSFLKSLVKGEMLKWSVLYVISIIGTLAASLVFRSRVFALGFAIAQIVSLSWIIAVSVPGGKTLIKAIQTAIGKCCSYFARVLFRTG